MAAPHRPVLTQQGQPYIDIPAVFADETAMAAAVRAVCGWRPPPPRLTLAYDRQALKWVRGRVARRQP